MQIADHGRSFVAAPLSLSALSRALRPASRWVCPETVMKGAVGLTFHGQAALTIVGSLKVAQAGAVNSRPG